MGRLGLFIDTTSGATASGESESEFKDMRALSDETRAELLKKLYAVKDDCHFEETFRAFKKYLDEALTSSDGTVYIPNWHELFESPASYILALIQKKNVFFYQDELGQFQFRELIRSDRVASVVEGLKDDPEELLRITMTLRLEEIEAKWVLDDLVREIKAIANVSVFSFK